MNDNIFEVITPSKFNSKLNENNYILIDFRTPIEVEQNGYIFGAKNIDYYGSDFIEQLSNLDKDNKYLTYCRSSARTSLILPIMKELGFKEVYDLKGGLLEWVNSGYKLNK